jgi:glycosyltransferase involved in cell wall biosynthesis
VEIDYIWGPAAPKIFGIPRYSYEIQKRMPGVFFRNIAYPWVSEPHLDALLKLTMLPLGGVFGSRRGRIKHIASQGYAFTIPFLRKGPVILTCNDIIPWTFYQRRSVTWKANVRALQQLEHIIAISEYTKKELMVHLGIPEEKIEVIYDGYDRYTFYPVSEPDRPRYLAPEDKVLLYTGSEEPRKNLGMLLQVLQDLAREMPEVKLIKAGGPGIALSQKRMRDEVRRMGLDNHVIFTGTISDDELRTLYNIADVFVFPSLCEGFGLPPLEAMACGCPVVASDRTSIPEVVGDAGILIDPEEQSGWYDVLARILNDPTERVAMKKKSLEQSGRFSWDECAKKTYEAYCRIENNPRNR